jgi:hypothetical protein
MKIGLILLASLVLVSSSTILAQDATNAAQTAENLCAWLRDIQAQGAALQNRVQLLDEALRPENIERALAGVDCHAGKVWPKGNL